MTAFQRYLFLVFALIYCLGVSLIYLFAGYRINLLFRGFKGILFALFALG